MRRGRHRAGCDRLRPRRRWWLRDADVQRHAASALADYFDQFTGGRFERFVAQSDPTEFTSTDMVAVSTLSIQVPANAAAELLLPGPRRHRCRALLGACPAFEAELWSVSSSAIADDGPLGQLYREVRQIPGLGRTITSKLLAAKRPGLVPIRDERVERFVGAGTPWWRPMREIMLDGEVRDILSSITADVVLATVTCSVASTSCCGRRPQRIPPARSPSAGEGPRRDRSGRVRVARDR